MFSVSGRGPHRCDVRVVPQVQGEVQGPVPGPHWVSRIYYYPHTLHSKYALHDIKHTEHSLVRVSTYQYTTVQYSTVQYSTVMCSTVQ